MNISIIKYGMGNVASVQKAINKLGYKSVLTNNRDEIIQSDFILLPGVGSFKKGIENLSDSGLVDFLTEEVVYNKKPFLGICLGMQLLAKLGNEPNKVEGLGWIDGEVIKIPNEYKVPHLGWNNVYSSNKKNEWYDEFNNVDFYFIHGYYFNAFSENDISLTVDYNMNMVAGLQKDNIYACQFHPEKSQDAGLRYLKKIIGSYVKV